MLSLWTELPGTACSPRTRGSRAEKGFTLSFESRVPMTMTSFSDLFPLLSDESQSINPQEASSLTRIPLTGACWPDFCSVPVASQTPEPSEGGRKASRGVGAVNWVYKVRLCTSTAPGGGLTHAQLAECVAGQLALLRRERRAEAPGPGGEHSPG